MSTKDQLISFLQQAGPASAEKVGLTTPNSSFALSLPPLDLDSTAKKVAELDLKSLRSLARDRETALENANQYARKVRELRAVLLELDRRISVFGDEEKFVKERKKQLDQVFKNLLISHVEYVENNVTIFTTQFLKKQQRLLGIFRIWIDWNASSSSSGISILNFYKRNGGCDHPCISGGRLCMGTAAETIEKHFREKNVFVLLETLMAFLLSENVSHGYIKSWSTWLSGRRAVPRGFSFDSQGIRPVTTRPSPPITRPSPNPFLRVADAHDEQSPF